MRLARAPGAHVEIPAPLDIVRNRQTPGIGPHQQAGERSRQHIINFNCCMNSSRSRCYPAHSTNSIGVIATDRVRQHAPYAASLLELPKPTCWSYDLPTMQKSALLQADGQQKNACRRRIHLVWQQVQGRLNSAFKNAIQVQNFAPPKILRGDIRTVTLPPLTSIATQSTTLRRSSDGPTGLS